MTIRYEIPLSKRQLEFLNLMMNGSDGWGPRSLEEYRKLKRKSMGIAGIARELSHHPINRERLIVNVEGNARIPERPPLKDATVHRLARSLYGILSPGDFASIPFYRHPINGYFIHTPLNQAVEEALQTGVFIGEINEEDLPILNAVYEQDRKIRAQFRMSWNPRFHPTEVGRLAGIDKSDARKGLERLTGILGVALVEYSHTFDTTAEAKAKAQETEAAFRARYGNCEVIEEGHGIQLSAKEKDLDPNIAELFGDEVSVSIPFQKTCSKGRFKWFVPNARRDLIARVLEENRVAVPA